MKLSASAVVCWVCTFVLSACMRPTVDSAAGTGVESGAVYVASSRGEVYYWIGCDNWRSIAPDSRRWFMTAADAEAAGYRASTARGCEAPERRAGQTPVESGTCSVERVVDGDTLVCAEAAERVRLLLVDAPELAQAPFGAAARDYLAGLLPLGTVTRVELDVQERDRYGRVLAYLYTPDGLLVNEMVARAGFGVPTAYAPNVRHVERIRVAAEEARRSRAGLWSESAFECLPADYRSRSCRAAGDAGVLQ